MPSFHHLPEVPPELIEKAKRALPPARFPRGFFDPLVTPTRLLLDRGLKLAQAADWLIRENALDPHLRHRYRSAMQGRLSRLRRKQSAAGEIIRWRASLGHDSVHAVGSGLTALCGARTGRWFTATSTATRCSRCIGAAASDGVTVVEE